MPAAKESGAFKKFSGPITSVIREEANEEEGNCDLKKDLSGFLKKASAETPEKTNGKRGASAATAAKTPAPV